MREDVSASLSLIAELSWVLGYHLSLTYLIAEGDMTREVRKIGLFVARFLILFFKVELVFLLKLCLEVRLRPLLLQTLCQAHFDYWLLNHCD